LIIKTTKAIGEYELSITQIILVGPVAPKPVIFSQSSKLEPYVIPIHNLHGIHNSDP